MPDALEELFLARTDRNTNGTISHEWDRVLFWRDMERLIDGGFARPVACPPENESSRRNRRCFRDTATGIVYMYVEGWERGSPEFRKLA